MCSPLGTKNHSIAKELKTKSMWLESKAKENICRRWAWEAHGNWKPSGRPSGHHSLSNQSEVKVKVTQPCPTLSDPMDYTSPWNSPGQNTGVGSLSLLWGILPTQGLNPGLPHCGWILYQLSHKGSPRILEWVGYPFSGSTVDSLGNKEVPHNPYTYTLMSFSLRIYAVVQNAAKIASSEL